MNTAALKKFAPALRTQLIAAVGLKLDVVLSARTPDYLTTFAVQVAALRKVAQADRPALIERVAYTWFNRLAALRFMDARGWHPFRARVLTPANPTETQPELLKVTRTGALPEELKAHTDAARLNALLDGHIPSSDPQGEVYRHLVLAACRFYNALLPDLFERLDDETELLLPDDLLTEQAIVHGFRTEISDDDCGDGQRANVELLGWLYQFYISERKDEVMARKKAVPTEDIPAVTQLFTPHWIVRYLVENSLGRLWLLNRPGSLLREHMPYYIEGEAETDFLEISKPEDIRLLDPAAGSGHMLTYAFDLLTLIYEEEGYPPSEIPALILRHNLYGLDICPRAAQLATLALVFKAREKSRRFFLPEHLVRPHILELRDVCFQDNELSGYFKALDIQPSALNPQLTKLLYQFEEAKNFGSLIRPYLDERAIVEVRHAIKAKDLGSQIFLRETQLKVLRVLEQAETLTQRYHVVVANPPYMGAKQMNNALRQFANENYDDSRTDLFAMFIERGLAFLLRSGLMGMINLPSWLFLPSYASLREKLIAHCTIDSLLHMGRGIFGIDWGSVAFVVKNAQSNKGEGHFFRLHKSNFQHIHYEDIGRLFLNANADKSYRYDFDEYRDDQGTNEIPALSNLSGQQIYYRCSSGDFKKIPDSPIVYWLSGQTLASFAVGVPMGDIVSLKAGMSTGDNTKFQRQWHEVAENNTCRDAKNAADASVSGSRWFPCHSGGAYRKWYGNHSIVVDWGNNGLRIKRFGSETGSIRSAVRNEDFYYREGITWSKISSGTFAARFRPTGFLFDDTGRCGFAAESTAIYKALAIFCSRLSDVFLKALCPTLSFTSGEIAKIPFIDPGRGDIVETVKACISLARTDWDNFETSWDFCNPPLLRPGLRGQTLEASWRNWEAQCIAAICRMQKLETENNRLFISAYGLDDELSPEVPEDQITLARAEARRDMAAFLSYAVGCMMGRYSLDHPGLILANAGDTLAEFMAKVGRSQDQLTFVPDEDGILPLLDGEWFEDDIVARTRDFLRAIFGEATLRENIRFIEESLGKDLRRYFLTDFYKDHLQTYKKRPIYWLVQSPQKGFSVLVYLHRYTKDTMNLVLNRYLREFQTKARNRLPHLAEVQATAATAREKTEARKEADKLTKTLLECEEWERQSILPLAQQRIALDLDDGVKTNYLKLGEALAPIPGFAAAEE